MKNKEAAVTMTTGTENSFSSGEDAF